MVDAEPKIEIVFEFWGVVVKVLTTSRGVSEHLRYYFGRYATQKTESDEVLWIDTSGNGDLGTWQVRRHSSDGSWTLLDPSSVTLLPPFLHPRLTKRFKTLHASAVGQVGDGEESGALVISGESMAGKSTLALEIGRRGWSFISDDTVLVTRNRRIVPYFRPVGIRASSYDLMPWLHARATSGMEIQTPTGFTQMVQAEDLGLAVIDKPLDWRWTILLSHSKTMDIADVGPSTLAVKWDPASHLDAIADEVANWLSSSRTGGQA